MPRIKSVNHSGLSACLICCLFLTTDLCAEIATDGSLGQPAQTLIGPDFSVPEALGSRAGDNLFHSFQRFNIHTGESATFTGADTITNVISRVTGGELSTIDGRLTSEIGTADFYFINPAGVMFGANAQVSVPGSFYVSTANELRFTDGKAYSATHPESSTLSIKEPASFGFLGDQTGSISMLGSNLLFEPASTVALSGNELKIDQSELIIDQGDIQLVATGSAATAVTVAGDLSVPAAGKLTITDSKIDASGEGAGRIVIQGGASQIESSKIFANNTGPSDASAKKGIDIHSGSLNIDNSNISTDTLEQGQQAANLSVEVAEELLIVNGGAVKSDTLAAGDGGQVRVAAGTLTIDGQGSNFFTGLNSQAGQGSSGKAGIVTVTVSNAVLIANGGLVTGGTRGEGDGGQVGVTAGTLTIDRQGSDNFTGISSQTRGGSSGNAGSVTVTVDNAVSIVNGGAVSSSTFAAGDGGQVRVSAGTLTIDGQGSDLVTGIASFATSDSLGQAGNITLNTQNLSIINRGIISIESEPEVDGTTLFNILPANINITAQNLTLVDASISAESFGNIPAGSITLNVADILSLDPSSITTAANNADGGAISINARVIDLKDSRITTSATGEGIGGDLTLNSKVLILDSGFIQTNASELSFLGGNIKINTDALIASHNQLLIGGTPIDPDSQPGINIIQATGPGSVSISTPQLDIGGNLTGLGAALLDVADIALDPCATPGGRQSTLSSVGTGGLAETPAQAGSVAVDPERLKRLLPPAKDLSSMPLTTDAPDTSELSEVMIQPLPLLARRSVACG